MTQIQVSLPNGAVKCVLGPPGAGEQAGGSSAAFAGAPAATAVPSPRLFAGTLFEFSLCLRRFSSNDLIRPARAFGGSDFRFIIRLAKSGMMRRWRKKAAG